MPEFYDNTVVAAHRNCPRRMYYRHVKHWTGAEKALPPNFGICLHDACDSIWQDISELPLQELNLGIIAKKALEKFAYKWDELGLPASSELEALYNKRRAELYNIANAGAIIRQYIIERAEFIRRHKLLAIERPFVVPLYPDRTDVFYCGRMDKVIEDSYGNIWGVDHKSSSAYAKSGGFQPYFLESFSPNNQIDGYSYAGMMRYGKKFKGMLVDGILVHKDVRAYCIIPVERDVAHLDNWLHDTRREVERIMEQKTAMAGVIEGAPFLPQFPKNTQRCFDFNSPCPYTDLCKCLPNPHFHETPPGYIVEEWSPFDQNELDKIGFTKE